MSPQKAFPKVMCYRYPLLILYVIIVSWVWAIGNCLKSSKKVKEEKKTLRQQTMPISYETDPATLEKERRARVAENRVRMRKKREKMNRNEFAKFAAQVESQQKAQREVSKLEEAPTQASCLEEEVRETVPSNIDGTDKALDKANVEIPSSYSPVDEGYKIAHMKLTSESENLGNLQLINRDPDAANKRHQIKKQARDVAKQKEEEEALMRLLNLSPKDDLYSPDDTLKNVPSILRESQLSAMQKKRERKKEKEKEKEKEELREKTAPGTSEERIRAGDLVEPKCVFHRTSPAPAPAPVPG